MSAARWMRRNKSEAAPTQLMFVDTETNSEIVNAERNIKRETFRLGHAISCRLERGRKSRRTEFPFASVDAFWRYVVSQLSPHRPLWLWGHNVGFDMRVLCFPASVERGLWTINKTHDFDENGQKTTELKRPRKGLFVLHDTPFIVECWSINGGMLRIIDTFNFFRDKLETVAHWIGREKLPMPERSAPDSTWATYCKRDCEIVEEAVIRLIKFTQQHQMGMFRLTAPSQSLACFRHRFMKQSIEYHDNEKCTKLERAGYYGGQLDCYYVGRIAPASEMGQMALPNSGLHDATRPSGPIIQLDCNSLYPSIMRGNHFPYQLIEYRSYDDWQPFVCMLDCKQMIARVRISTKSEEFAKRFKGQTVFPIGKFETVLAGAELDRAVSTGSVVAVKEFARYNTYEMFTEFVDYFWQHRYITVLAGNEVESKLCKLILNSLHGKFAQRLPDWVDCDDVIAPEEFCTFLEVDKERGIITHYRSFNWRVQKMVERAEHPQAFPAIAAFVTAYAREKMREYKRICGVGNYYYQGVDSLYVSTLGLRNLNDAGCVDAEAMGKLRIVREAADAEFHNLNRYRIGERNVISSIRTTAVKVGNGEWRQECWQGNEEGFLLPKQGGVIVRERNLSARSAYNRSPVDRNGWTRPLELWHFD